MVSEIVQAGVQGTSAMWAHGINMYQYNQEKKRQERLDRYNKSLNAQQYRSSIMQNSPSYQLSRERQAGMNPLAQGIQPVIQPANAGSPVTGQQMPVGAVGESAANIGTSIGEAIEAIRNYRLAKKQLELNKEKTEADIDKTNNDIELQVAQMYHKMVEDNKITVDQANDSLNKVGNRYKIEGNSIQKRQNEQALEASVLSNEAKKTENKYLGVRLHTEGNILSERYEQSKVETKMKRLEYQLKRYSFDLTRLGLNDESKIPWAIKFPLRLLIFSESTRKALFDYLESKAGENGERLRKSLDFLGEALDETGKSSSMAFVALAKFIGEFLSKKEIKEEDVNTLRQGVKGKF